MSKHHTVAMLRDARTTLLRNKLSGPLTAGLLAHIKMLEAEIERESEADTKHAELMQVGKSAYSSIADMVAALNCDYDRLECLKQERDDFVSDHPDYTGKLSEEKIRAVWALINVDDAKELVELEAAAGECTSEEEARIRIHEDALSVEVRSDWIEPRSKCCGDCGEPVEFRILLSTGGPATRIVGELQDCEPTSARLEVQDWGTPWTEYREKGLEDVLLDYCRCFYFGEG